jgi:glutathione synthase/RimK-type ligase-like ATP-grasp enzyme
MNTKIMLLTDYQGRFGSKYCDRPYRSGFSKLLLEKYFKDMGYSTEFVPFSEISFKRSYREETILYTSSEDMGYHYKKYLEDIVFGLELQGAAVIPAYKYLRANNNKVFMEILREDVFPADVRNIKSNHFGTLEELVNSKEIFNFPVVLKKSEGAGGKGVYLAHSFRELLKIVNKISRTRYCKYEMWDWGRTFKYEGYQPESRHRSKFIVQQFIADQKNDWKIYIFGARFYIFYRPILKHREFRASGGGYQNYFYGKDAHIPDGLFDFAKKIFDCLHVPHASLDIAYDGSQFVLLEYQCLYFGTAGIVKSNEYYVNVDGHWEAIPEKIEQEKVFADAIINYLKA